MTQQTMTESKTVEMSGDVLVLGGGIVALETASAIAARGYRVTVAESNADVGRTAESLPLVGMDNAQLDQLVENAKASDRIEILNHTQFAGSAGMPGNFKVWLATADEVVEKTVGAIVVAGKVAVEPLNAAYGLELGETVLSQTQLETRLGEAAAGFNGKTVAFMTGLAQPGNPVNMERVFRSALVLSQQPDCSVYVYVGDLKVAFAELERLYLETRDKGAIYVKLREMPAIRAEAGTLAISYTDPVLRQAVELIPDIIVVEEALTADGGNDELAEMLHIELGAGGFMQTDNVHRYPVATNREGIFVVGAGAKVNKVSGAVMDAENAALQVSALLSSGSCEVDTGTTLDSGKCVFCLTCYRCCPHGAIYWENESNTIIDPLACQGCGICASECPQDAIQIGNYSDAEMKDRIESAAGQQTEDPTIVAFCCQNSAVGAGQMAEQFDMALPKGLKTVQVPCAGKVDMDYILSAFVEGADGVLVLGCHAGNCKSERGNTFAQWRVQEAQRMLSEIGMDAGQLKCVTLAANMGNHFARIVNQMEADLKARQ